jgi:hypothetical protein
MTSKMVFYEHKNVTGDKSITADIAIERLLLRI